jgi:ABC-type uncharacterized transport system permease subunit
MKNFLKQLFDDSNTINEKAVVGYVAFLMMIISLTIDLVTGWLGRPLIINEFIFNGFMVIVLGSFGIASVDKWLNKKSLNEDPLEEPKIEEPKVEE